MRDLAVSFVIFGSLPLILAQPWVGPIMWSWVSLMNPHKLAYGFAYSMPVAMIIGVVTLAAWVVAKQDRRVPVTFVTVTMGTLLAWTAFTTLFAFNQADAPAKLLQYFKIILMAFVAMSLIKEEKHFRYLIWITLLSLGYFSVKGGIFTIVTGGSYKVWGPPFTFVEDNNALALATLMVVPLMIYIGRTTDNKWVTRGMYAAALFSIASVVGSYSRGGLLGLMVLGYMLWWRSRRKVALGILGIGCVLIGISYIPEKWFDRMDTIQTYEEDDSAMSRIHVWTMAIQIANARPFVGGGFACFFHRPTFERFRGEQDKPRNVHSIYFEMLGSHGYPGLFLFLLLGLSGLLNCRWVRRQCRGRPELRNYHELAGMLQCSLMAYAVSGMFQNLATYDLYYNLLAFAVLNKMFLERRLAAIAAEAAETAPSAELQPADPRPLIAPPNQGPQSPAPAPAPAAAAAATAGPKSFLRRNDRTQGAPSFLRSRSGQRA